MSASTYAEKLKDPRWQKLRAEIIQRDGNRCRDCAAYYPTLDVHHCFYAKGEPWETHPIFLRTVCRDCHKTRQRYEDSAKESLAYVFMTLNNREGDDELRNFSYKLNEIAMRQCGVAVVAKEDLRRLTMLAMEAEYLRSKQKQD